MHNTRNRARRTAPLALIAAVAVLTGCSGSDGSAPSSDAGSPAKLGAAEFRSAAALACTSVLNHRRYELDYRADTELAMQALLMKLDHPTDADPEDVAAAIGRLADESRRAAGELSQVLAADPADQKLWDRVVQAQRDRADGFDRRQKAVQAGNYDDITPAETDTIDADALNELGLAERDCARMDAG